MLMLGKEAEAIFLAHGDTRRLQQDVVDICELEAIQVLGIEVNPRAREIEDAFLRADDAEILQVVDRRRRRLCFGLTRSGVSHQREQKSCFSCFFHSRFQFGRVSLNMARNPPSITVFCD